MSIGNLPEILSQGILVGITLAERLGAAFDFGQIRRTSLALDAPRDSGLWLRLLAGQFVHSPPDLIYFRDFKHKVFTFLRIILKLFDQFMV